MTNLTKHVISEPKMKTLVMERHSETCFSVEPMPECDSSDLIATSEKKKVSIDNP